MLARIISLIVGVATALGILMLANTLIHCLASGIEGHDAEAIVVILLWLVGGATAIWLSIIAGCFVGGLVYGVLKTLLK